MRRQSYNQFQLSAHRLDVTSERGKIHVGLLDLGNRGLLHIQGRGNIDLGLARNPAKFAEAFDLVCQLLRTSFHALAALLGKRCETSSSDFPITSSPSSRLQVDRGGPGSACPPWRSVSWSKRFSLPPPTCRLQPARSLPGRGSKAKATRQTPSSASKRNSFMLANDESLSVSACGLPNWGPNAARSCADASNSSCTASGSASNSGSTFRRRRQPSTFCPYSSPSYICQASC